MTEEQRARLAGLGEFCSVFGSRGLQHGRMGRRRGDLATLCIVDGADAAIHSGGDMIQFMLRANVIDWARFGTPCAEGVEGLVS